MSINGKHWQQAEAVYGLGQRKYLVTQGTDKTSKLPAKVVGICHNKKKYDLCYEHNLHGNIYESTR